jgi:hypothetical protein
MAQISSISRVGTTEPFELQISRGQISGHSVINIFGFATAIGTSFTTPWELANTNALPLISAASQLDVASSDAGDTTQIVQLQGLDADYNLITENVSLNGTTTVTTSSSFKAINGFITISGNCAGNVTAKISTVVYAQITAGTGRNQAAIYTVPAGHSFYLSRIDAFSATATGASKYVTFLNKNTFSDGRVFNVAETTFAQRMDIMRVLPFKVSEKTTVEFQAKLNSTTGEVGIFGEGFLVKEEGPL